MRRVLLVLANPCGTDPLRLMAEERAIRECIALSRGKAASLSLVLLASTIHDVRRALLADAYQIVHLSGHGTGRGLALEDELGHLKTIPYTALAGLLEAHSPPLECVVLNACYSSGFGADASCAVPYVIGMRAAISDPAASEFARGFYDAVAAGRGYEFSFSEGKRAISLADIPEESVPMLRRSPTVYLQQLFRQALPDSIRPKDRGLPLWLTGDLLKVFTNAVESAAASPPGQLTMRHFVVALVQLDGGVCADAISKMGGDAARIGLTSGENLERTAASRPSVEPTDAVRGVLAELDQMSRAADGTPDDGWILLAALSQRPLSVTIVELLQDLECGADDLREALIAARARRRATPARKREGG